MVSSTMVYVSIELAEITLTAYIWRIQCSDLSTSQPEQFDQYIGNSTSFLETRGFQIFIMAIILSNKFVCEIPVS